MGTALLAVTAAIAIAAAPASAATNAYHQQNVVSDQPGHAQLTDPHLVNAWGLASGPTTPIWAANNHTSTATIYTGAVHGAPAAIAPLVVDIRGGDPTGQVFNGSDSFKIKVNGSWTPALFLFDSESGHVTAWAPGTTVARIKASVPNAVYKGLTITNVAGRGPLLLAANFPRNRIDVFNGKFQRTSVSVGFHDPTLPMGWGPFNVQSIGDWVYVSYAKVDPATGDEVAGAGLGRVDVYRPNGVLVRRLAMGGPLNAPWGLVRAPMSFGAFGGDILVGNFGDGRITAFDQDTGHMDGQLRRPNGTPVVIDGLWGLRFGNTAFGGGNGLVFSAGPDDESHGLLGVLRPAM
jgi:uncharacterized protein (TIGR03118 family)